MLGPDWRTQLLDAGIWCRRSCCLWSPHRSSDAALKGRKAWLPSNCFSTFLMNYCCSGHQLCMLGCMLDCDKLSQGFIPTTELSSSRGRRHHFSLHCYTIMFIPVQHGKWSSLYKGPVLLQKNTVSVKVYSILNSGSLRLWWKGGQTGTPDSSGSVWRSNETFFKVAYCRASDFMSSE